MSFHEWTTPEHDPAFAPTHIFEASGSHKQATPEQAAERGWYFRSEWYKRMVPDTRRCWVHGEIMFDEAPMTDQQKLLGYKDQLRGMATGPLAG
jgi:hypothetical protein